MPFDSFFSDSSWVPPPLSLQLNAYSGYGVFAVDYCSIAQFSFQNNNGENGEFIVTPEDRRICYNNTLQATENGILVENLRVSIGNVLYIFAYQLSLFEGIISATLLPGLAMYGLLPPGPSIRTYELAVTPNKEYILLY